MRMVTMGRWSRREAPLFAAAAQKSGRFAELLSSARAVLAGAVALQAPAYRPRPLFQSQDLTSKVIA